MKKRYPFCLKSRLRFTLSFVVLAFHSLSLQAQTAPAKQWDKTLGGSLDDDLFAICQTSDGGYILGGSSPSPISGDKTQAPQGFNDYWVVKITVGGIIQWDKTFGGNGNEELLAVKQTSDGGYILGGTSYSGISGNKSQASKGGSDFWVVKLDASGNKIWDRTFGGNGDDGLDMLQQTSDGGYILGGTSYSGISGDKSQAFRGGWDYWVVKLDAGGNKIWDKTFGGIDDEYLNSIQQTSDGGYVLGGFSRSGTGGDKSQGSRGGMDYWIVKLDVAGNKLWDKAFGGQSEDILTSLQQTSDGGYVLGGYSPSPVSSDKSQNSIGIDYWVLKLNAGGNKIWDKTFGGSSHDYLLGLHQTLDGGFILGGGSNSGISSDKTQASNGKRDFWVLKLNANGTKLWDKTLGGSNDDEVVALQQTSDGGYILGGVSDSDISPDKGEPSRGLGYFDYWVVKLAPDVLGIEESEAHFNLSVIPNPSKGKFKLHLGNLTAPTAEITVSDLLGRVVLQKEIQITNNQLSEEISLPKAKGLYLLQLKAGNERITRKIVVE